MEAPFIIVSSGQSNMGNRAAHLWDVPTNLKMWDFWGQYDASTYVGSCFSRPDGTKINVSMSFAAEVARNNPDRDIYLIDFSKGAKEIANWGTTPPSYNFREAIEGNMPLAMAATGCQTIDLFLWWQGESDASYALNTPLASYCNAYNEFQAWLRGKPWYTVSTPQLIFSLPTYCEERFSLYNGTIRNLVASQPGLRKFVDTSCLPITLWDNSGTLPYIHMTAEGYKEAGKVGYQTWAGQATDVPAWGYYTPVAHGVANIISVSSFKSRWNRIGNMASVNGRVDVTPSLAGNTVTTIAISLPIPSNFTNGATDLSGQANTRWGLHSGICPSIAGDYAEMQFPATNNGINSFYYSFQYTIN